MTAKTNINCIYCGAKIIYGVPHKGNELVNGEYFPCRMSGTIFNETNSLNEQMSKPNRHRIDWDTATLSAPFKLIRPNDSIRRKS